MRGPASDQRRKTHGGSPGDAASTHPERGVVDGAVAGDAAAFETLVRRHYADVWRLVHGIVRREREAEEVAQEVFLGARAALPEYRGDVPFDAWLRRLAVGRAARAVKPGRSRRRRFDGAQDGPAQERRKAPRPLDPAQDRRLLEASLTTLDGSQRAAFTLQLEGLDYAEMAGELDVPIGTIRNRIAMGREYMSRFIAARRAVDDR